MWRCGIFPHLHTFIPHNSTRVVLLLFAIILLIINMLNSFYNSWHGGCIFIGRRMEYTSVQLKKCGIMKKLMLSVAVFMMSVSVTSFVSYAQCPSEEPAPTDSVPAQEPKGEAFVFCLNEEPAPADSVPTQEPKGENSLFCLAEEPAPTDSVPTQEPTKEEPQGQLSLLCLTEEPTDSVPTQEPTKEEPQTNLSIA